METNVDAVVRPSEAPKNPMVHHSAPFVLVVCALCVGCVLLPDSTYRQALPGTATEIQEHREGIVDFTYLLKARLTEEEFSEYVAWVGLQPVDNAGWESTGFVESGRPHDDDPEWWSPIRSVDPAFQRRIDSDIISAKYEDGFLYLSVVHL